MKRLILIISVVLLVALPAHAQESDLSAEEQALLEVVNTAFDNLEALSSYQLEANITFQQTVNMGVANMDMSQSGTAAVSTQLAQTEGELTAMRSLTTSTLDNSFAGTMFNMDSASGDINLEAESIFVDATYYTRTNMTIGDTAIPNNNEWQIITGDEVAAFTAEFGLDNKVIDSSALLNPISSGFFYLLNPDTVTAIRELDSEEVDGQTLRVFEVEINFAALLSDEQLEALEDLPENEQFDFSNFDFDALLANLSDGITLTQTLWIGADDNLPHRSQTSQLVDAEFNVADLGVDLGDTELPMGLGAWAIDQTSTTEIRLFGFDEPVDISAPDTEL